MTTFQMQQEARTQFEQLARVKGFRDFGRRGDFYNVTELNHMWEGYKLAI